MSLKQAKITHLFHSSFIVETENSLLIFDYFDYASHYIIKSSKILSDDFFNTKKNIYVFVSHSHQDHYDPIIFEWEKYNSNIQYILSSDVEIEENRPNYHILGKYEELLIDSIKINSYGSTDLGLSYLINIEGLSVFHAGDLNWWHWKNDDKQTQLKEEEAFKSEVNLLKDIDIDIAFIPVDPRLQEAYYLAGEYFAKTIKPNLLVPMHFSDKFSISKKLKKKLHHLDVNIAVITEKNRKFAYSK